MTSLSDRLKALGVVSAKGPADDSPPASAYPIERAIAGRLVDTEHGATFVAEQRHPLDLPHGCASLRITASLQVIAEWAREPRLVEVERETFAFLDAETTGLARGAGTYAFLIGAGRYDGDAFQVTQFFMRDPAEEPALLAALGAFLAPCQALVTFNGKTFDMPLLQARYVANGQDFGFGALPHLDLLSLARRLWRSRLPSRALSCLEDQILGLPRTGEDVPGWMIPELYFEYLRDGDARPLQGVFYHNATDVLSMVALLSHGAALLADPLDDGVPPLDQADMGRLFEDLGQIEIAAKLFKRALTRGLPPHARAQTVRRWSFLEKRRDNQPVAIKLWRDATSRGEIYAHVELAKAHEHRERNYPEAIRWTEAAIDLVNGPDFPPHERDRWMDELAHRLARLRRKQ